MSVEDTFFSSKSRDHKVAQQLEAVDQDFIRNKLLVKAGIPEDYVDFISQFGWGELGAARYMFYQGLVDADEIYGNSGLINKILLFGDDFSGVCNGFRTDDWSVIGIGPGGEYLGVVADSFKDFVYKIVGELFIE